MSSPGVEIVSCSTRRSYSEALHTVAQTMQVKSGECIRSLKSLEDFVAAAVCNSIIGSTLEDLDISLPMHVGYPAHLLRSCLCVTPNLEALILTLPTGSPESLLNNVTFPNLKLFSTNLPHQFLVIFLSNHSTITSLVLRACGRASRCALQDVDLSHVTELQSPARCFSGILRGQVSTASVNLTRAASSPFIAIHSLSSSPLYSLVIEFYPDDYDILNQISRAAPCLRRLKLVEKPRTQRRSSHGRRPWNDPQSWHITLLRLPLLESFMLRTAASVVRAQRTEASIILGWANGVTRRAVAHPNLSYISLLQGVDGVHQGLSHWIRRNGGQWENMAHALVDRTHSFCL